MSGKRVLYFFSFASWYSALADSRLDHLVAEAGGYLEPLPLILTGAPEPTGIEAVVGEFKITYLTEDAERWFRRLGIPWNPPEAVYRQRWPGHRFDGFPDATDATAGWYFARERGSERAYRNAIFRALWCESRDIGDPRVLAACGETAGLSQPDFIAALESKRWHNHVWDGIQRCAEERVFGVPTFVVAGKRFWGNDRIDFLLEELRGAA
jgi:2-hydroxychromene-2-carboxylate isomerase